MLQMVLRTVSVIVVAAAALISGLGLAQASDNEGEQRELDDIRTQECSNERNNAWGDASPQQLLRDNCQP